MTCPTPAVIKGAERRHGSAYPATDGAQIKWWLAKPDGTWSVAQNWGSARFTWNTGDLAAGNYRIVAYARHTGSSAEYEAHGFKDFVLQ